MLRALVRFAAQARQARERCTAGTGATMASNPMLPQAEADGCPMLDLAEYLRDAPGALNRLARELRDALGQSVSRWWPITACSRR